MNHSNLVASSSFQNMACRNIHVLLVDHETRDHDNIINLLHYFSYKVTSVNLVSMALSILSKGKVQFDLVMVNMNLPDPLGFQLLQDATKMKLLVIFMSNVDDALTSMRALEQGAFLCIRKPLSMAIAGSLWQLVMSEKARRPKEREPLITKMIDNYNFQEKKLGINYVLESNINNSNLEEKEKSKSENEGGRYRRKGWTEWTLELHRKFMAAAKQLGQGKCYPKDILEIMNVPGLTRMQVASHLQKCRNANWLPPNERKSKVANRETTPKKGSKTQRAKTVRFGLMPFWEEEYSQFHATIQEYYQDQSTINPPTQTTSVFGHDHGFDPDNNIQFVYGDYQTDVAPLTNFLPNEDPFELLPIMDSEMVHEFPHFQQELEMDFDADWESFILDGGGYDQVSDATNQCFHPAMENDENEDGQMKEG